MAHVVDHLSFATLADLECAVVERCRVLKDDPLRLGTNFHWWAKPITPAQSAANRIIQMKDFARIRRWYTLSR